MSQLPFMAMLPQSDWKPPRLQDLPQDWSEIPRISIDVETKDPDLSKLGCGARRPGCHVVGFGIAFDLGPGDMRSFYLPVRHEDGGNMELANVRAYLDDNMRNYRGRITGAELSYDGDYMMQEGIRFHPDALLHDVATNDSLINEHSDGFTLDKVGKRWGHAGKDERLLRNAASYYGDNAKSVLYQMHSKYVGEYACRDVELPLLIDTSQQKTIEEQELTRAVDLEAAVLPVTIYMRRHGIRINVKALEQVEAWAGNTQMAYLTQFQHITGIRVSMEDLRSSPAMVRIMKILGLRDLPVKRRYDKKKKEWVNSAPSIDAETLKDYRDHRIDLLCQAKKLDKILTTYAPSIWRYMTNGRVHGTLKSVRGSQEGSDESDDQKEGTVSRRFAHRHPNLGNQPNPTRDEDDALRVEMGTRWRSIFVPDSDDEDWGLADFSQQEPRWIVNDAESLGLRGAREMGNAFRNDSRTDNHTMISKLTHLPRGPAKITFLARCYGAGYAKIALQLGDKMRELDALARAGSPKAPPNWTLLPDGWEPVYDAWYGKDDWIPPTKCVGDLYQKASPECIAIIKQFDEYAPYVRDLAKAASRRAKERGYILLIDWGRARLETDFSGNIFKDEHKALNKRAQGNGAVQLKLFLVALYREGLLPHMTVHDDVSKSVGKGDAGTKTLLRMKEIGENVVPYVPPGEYEKSSLHYKSRIPWLIKVKRGDSYGTADSAKEINVG